MLHSSNSPVGLHELGLRNIKHAHLNFMVYAHKQASIHTHMHNAVTLVWGLLRFVPMMYMYPSL